MIHPVGILEQLRRLFTFGALGDEADVTYLYLRCKRCGEPLRVRVRRSYEFSQVFDERTDDVVGFELHKEIVGSRCNRLIRVHIRLDRGRNEVSREAENADFLTPDEYAAAVRS